MRSLPLALLLVLSLVVAGCVDDPAPLPPDDTSAPGATPADTPAGAAQGPTGATPGATGSSTTAPAPPPPTEPKITTRTGTFTVKAYPPLGAPVAAGEGHRFEIRFTGNITGIILLLEWTPGTPLTNELELWVHSASAIGSDFGATGTSPLRLPIAAADVVEPGYVVDVLPPRPLRAGANQEFTFTIASFEGLPFDPEWSPDGTAP